MVKRFSLIVLLLASLTSTAWGATVTITGNVQNPDGTPMVNSTIQFNSVVTQILSGGIAVPPKVITTTTDANGALKPWAITQGLQGQFTFCNPAAGGCSPPTPALIPFASSATIATVLAGTALGGGGGGGGGGGTITGPTPPSSPTVGQLWYDTSSSPAQLKVWDGAGWIVVSNESGQNSGPTPPTNPVKGQLWYDTSSTPHVLKVYDGTTWVAAGGGTTGGPWLPVNNPAYTGNMTGTLTSAYNAAAATLAMTANGNWYTQTSLTNTTNGVSAREGYILQGNAGNTASFQLINSGFTAAGNDWSLGGNAAVLETNAATSWGGGLSIVSTNPNATVMDFWINNFDYVELSHNNLGYSGMYLWDWKQDGNTSNTFTPIVQVSNEEAPTGSLLLQESGFTAVVETTYASAVPWNPSYHHLWLQERGMDFNNNASIPGVYQYPDSGFIGSEGGTGMAIGTLSGATLDFFNGNMWVMETNSPYSVPYIPVTGLMLPGADAPSGDFYNLYNGQAGLLIGNINFNTVDVGELAISSGAYSFATGAGQTWNQWRTDTTGAWAGAITFTLGYGPWAGFYWSDPWGTDNNWAAASPGLNINVGHPSLELWGYGVYPVHLETPGDAPVPWVTSGQLAAGSRDSFGWIVNVTGGQTTLVFGTPFYGYQSACTLTDAGQPLLWYAANQGTTQVTFVCVIPSTGAACPDNWGWVEYHCAGLD